jgi:hypothetical protein
MNRHRWIDFHDKRRLKDARNGHNVAEKIEIELVVERRVHMARRDRRFPSA